MPTYVYETIPQSANETPQRFELKQSMSEKPLTQHPESGAPVRRIISGGTGILGGGGVSPAPSGGSCGTGCGCHN